MCICENCHKQNITINSHYSADKYYLICKKCLCDIEICSKTKSKQIFHLTDSDIQNIRLIYLENNTIYQFYKYEDIKNAVIAKYGTLQNFQVINLKKSESREVKIKKMEDNKLLREKIIKDTFRDNKLEFKNYGDTYTYIHYGKPSIEIVLQNELNKLNQKTNRRKTLAMELHKIDIPLNESLKSCYEYINALNTKPIEDVIRHIEIEHFLKHNTNYDNLCQKYNSKQAKEIAIQKYTETQKLPNHIATKYKNTKVTFE